jgi:hypothetical protein
MSHVFVIWGFVKVLYGHGYIVDTPLSHIPNINQTTFLIYWGFANGPLGFNVIMQKNALVFHSLKHMASLLIHYSPVTVVWTMRWAPEQINARWPGVFGMPIPPDDEAVTFLDIFLPTLIIYLCWMVLYLIWMYF